MREGAALLHGHMTSPPVVWRFPLPLDQSIPERLRLHGRNVSTSVPVDPR